MFNSDIHSELLELGFEYIVFVDYPYPYSHKYKGFKYSYDDKIIISKYEHNENASYYYIGFELTGFDTNSEFFKQKLFDRIECSLRRINVPVSNSFTNLTIPPILEDFENNNDIVINGDWVKLDDFHWQMIVKFNILKIKYNVGSKDFSLLLNDSHLYTNKSFNNVISYFENLNIVA